MKTEMRTIRIGELLGPIDWSFDFAASGWDRGGCMNPAAIDPRVAMLRTLDEGIDQGEQWEATTYGGIPRVGWGRVHEIGMYDGWPYWSPVPSVFIGSWTGGGEWSSWSSLADIRRLEAGRV